MDVDSMLPFLQVRDHWIESRTGITCPHCDGFDRYHGSEVG